MRLLIVAEASMALCHGERRHRSGPVDHARWRLPQSSIPARIRRLLAHSTPHCHPLHWAVNCPEFQNRRFDFMPLKSSQLRTRPPRQTLSCLSSTDLHATRTLDRSSVFDVPTNDTRDLCLYPSLSFHRSSRPFDSRAHSTPCSQDNLTKPSNIRSLVGTTSNSPPARPFSCAFYATT